MAFSLAVSLISPLYPSTFGDHHSCLLSSVSLFPLARSWPDPMVSAVSPAIPPRFMDSTGVLIAFGYRQRLSVSDSASSRLHSRVKKARIGERAAAALFDNVLSNLRRRIARERVPAARLRRPLEFFHPLRCGAPGGDRTGRSSYRAPACRRTSRRHGRRVTRAGRCAPARVRSLCGRLGSTRASAPLRVKRLSGVRLRSQRATCVERSQSRSRRTRVPRYAQLLHDAHTNCSTIA